MFNIFTKHVYYIKVNILLACLFNHVNFLILSHPYGTITFGVEKSLFAVAAQR